jgi:acyl-CoA dehydrogenase
LADVSLLLLGGSLKRRENLSARLGDIHSHLYLLSAVLKQYQDHGKQTEDLPIVRWSSLYCLYKIQEAMDGLLKNYPNRWLKYILRWIVFPWGKHFSLPSDKLSHKVTQLLLESSGARDRLSAGVYTGNLMAEMEDALLKVIAAEPIEKMVKQAVNEGLIKGSSLILQAKAAMASQIISEEQFYILLQANEARHKVIAVDDFASDELMRVNMANHTNRENEIHATSKNNA